MRPLRLLLLSLAIVASAPTGSAVAASNCHDGRSQSAETLCWINSARASRGRAPVREDPRLARAAFGHSSDMAANHYFTHDSRDGTPFDERIAATGWMRRRPSWWVGETLAWGTGPRSEPAAIVRAWLDSPPHRCIVLSAGFRRVGIGIASGTPAADGAGGATYTADFGS